MKIIDLSCFQKHKIGYMFIASSEGKSNIKSARNNFFRGNNWLYDNYKQYQTINRIGKKDKTILAKMSKYCLKL